jgi:tetratricopeptide (TPR) repeat protein
MGLETDHVVSEEALYSVFECSICQNLVDLDALVTTACSHCYCRLCLHQWLERDNNKHGSAGGGAGVGVGGNVSVSNPKCPTCNRDLLYSNKTTTTQSSSSKSSSSAAYSSTTMMIGQRAVTVQPLVDSQPLAHRVLQRIQVHCTLRGVDCTWKGDYGDLQSHLLSQTAHNEEVSSTSTSTTTTRATTAAATRAAAAASRQQQQQHHQPSAETTNGGGDGDGGGPQPMETTEEEEEAEPSEISAAASSQRRFTFAQSYKNQANDRFSSGHYSEARDLYSKALSNLIPPVGTSTSTVGTAGTATTTTPTLKTAVLDEPSVALAATLYSNRAATYLAVQKYPAAVDDAEQAVRLDPGYTKAYVRQARGLVQLGKFTDACRVLQAGLVQTPTAQVLATELATATRLAQQMEEGLLHLQHDEYTDAKSVFGNLLRDTNSESVLLGAGRADLGLGLTASTLRLTIQVLKQNPQSAEGYLVRGHCLCLMGELEAGVKLLKESMRLDPDSTTTRTILKDCKKVQVLLKQGHEQFFHRDFVGAVEQFQAAIAASPLLPPKCPLYGTLHTECAQSYMRLKQYDAALKECALVLYACDDDVKAWLLKFQALHGLNRHQEALDEASDLMQHWGSNNEHIRKAHDKADFEVRKANRPDFYAMMGISSLASEKEIKKAYRQATLEFHPDRFAGNQHTDERRKKAEKDFQILGDGLEILSDDFKRQLYDEGYDLEAIKERVEAAQRAAHMGGDHYHHGRR